MASYLLPVLVRSFPIPRMWVRDADKLEEKNLDRQLFHPTQIGEYKASALLALLVNGINQENRSDPSTETGAPHNPPQCSNDPEKAFTPRDWISEPKWFVEGEPPSQGADLIICVADNHTARRAALQAADQANIPCIIGGNEYYDSQAIWVEPDDFYTKRNPFERYPEMLTDTSMNPVRCQGEALMSTPQLAIANMRCASHILDLLWLHKVVLPNVPDKVRPAAHQRFPFEIYTSINNPQYFRYGE